MTTRRRAGKAAAHLDQWRIIRVAEGTRHLVGVVSGHPRLPEGARIISSAVLDLAADHSRAETVNTIYQLGTPGRGALPQDWAEHVDDLLRWEWGTARRTDVDQ